MGILDRFRLDGKVALVTGANRGLGQAIAAGLAEAGAAIVARIPAGAWGEPGDLQGTALPLASSASEHMHGAVVPVDGGRLAR